MNSKTSSVGDGAALTGSGSAEADGDSYGLGLVRAGALSAQEARSIDRTANSRSSSFFFM
ncbi:MAG: hypothetical protein GX847_06070 [Clostridiales bacterium]|nr:hypothetical protein [Clostridiales bacterium]